MRIFSLLILFSTVLSSPQWINYLMTHGVHRKFSGSSSAIYYVFSQSKYEEQARENLLWLFDPCGERHNIINLHNRTVRCDDPYVKEFIGNETIVNDVCLIRTNGSLVNSGRDAFYDVIWIGEERCTCSKTCSDGIIVEKSPMCTCSRAVIDHQQACDFEGECSWKFGGHGFNTYPSIPKKRPFPLAVAKVDDPSKPATLYSPYYSQFSSSCTLGFLYNLAGTNEAEIRVYLEWRKYPGQNAKDSDVLISRINVHQENAGVLDYHEIRFGYVTKHARVRIECLVTRTEAKAQCKFNNLTWFNCQVSGIRQKCQGHNNPTLCMKDGRMECWADVTCDGIKDCENGEDEANCGSKCNFNNVSDPLCGWEEKASPVRRESNMLYILGKLNSNLLIEGVEGNILDQRVMRNQPRNDSGTFLLISAQRRTGFDTREYILESPTFPPTRQFTGDPTRPETRCTVRFKYCIKGAEQKFYLELERHAHLAKNMRLNFFSIWEPPAEKLAEVEVGAKCEWQQASIALPRQMLPFRLRFNMKLISRYRIPFIAIDDLSLHPNCFDFDSHTKVDVKQVYETCGKTGVDIPTSDDCRREAMSKGIPEVEHYSNGSRFLTIAADGFYWVKICGAAGGGFPMIEGEPGNCVVTSIQLREGQRMQFIVGQKGSSPCDAVPTETLSPQQEKLFKRVCSLDNSNLTEEVDPVLFIGAGGGGFSALFLANGSVGIVAGGGGGAFPPILPPGRTSVNGNGMSLSKEEEPEECNVECLEATPKMIDEHGTCFKKVPIETRGGYGGGGRSCGSGGGGGGGYFGGKYGRFGPGTTGSNFVTDQIFTGIIGHLDSLNTGDGSMTIIKCSLDCKFPQYCDFVSILEPDMVCACDPERVNKNGTCVARIPIPTTAQRIDFAKRGKISTTTPQEDGILANWYYNPIIFIMVFLFFLAIGLLLLVQRKYGCAKYFARKQQYFSRQATETIDDGQELNEINNQSQDMSIERLFGNQTFIKNLPIKNSLMLLNRIDDNDLELRQPIGQGAFGNVSLGILKIDGQEKEVAVKVLSPTWNSDESESLTRNFITEALLMSLSNNVGKATIQLIGVCLDRRPYKIVMELMKGGNLLNFLRSSRPNDESDNPNDLKMLDLMQFAKDIVEGCLILEKNQHLHRDLAARNCLLTTAGPGRRVKIGDFGLATELYDTGEYVSRVRHRAIPMKWMPPEAIRDGIFSSKTDVWSFGVVCWEIFTIGQVPYTNVPSDYLYDLLAGGKRLAQPKGCPREIYYDFILECWQPHPEDRPSFAELDRTLTKLLVDERFRSLEIPLVRGCLDKVSSPVAETPVFAEDMGTPVTVDTMLPTPLGTDEHWSSSEKTPLVDIYRAGSEPNSARGLQNNSTKSTPNSAPRSGSLASTPTKPMLHNNIPTFSTPYGILPTRAASGPSTPMSAGPWPTALPNMFGRPSNGQISNGVYENVVQLNSRFKIKNESYWQEAPVRPIHRQETNNFNNNNYNRASQPRQFCSAYSNYHQHNGHPERPTQLPLKETTLSK